MDHSSLPVRGKSVLKPKRKFADWISKPGDFELTPFQQLTLDVDWKNSPLGPMSGWPRQLRSIVLIVCADPLPAGVFWGDENAVVYNEPYTTLVGCKHPAMQGQNPCVQLAEVWDYFKALLDEQKETGLGVVQDNMFLLLQRHGFDEECYFSWKFVPIIGDEGYVIGSHATVVENTRQVLIDRRMSVVRSLTVEMCNVRTIQDLWGHLIRALELADKDAPMCLLYSASESSEVATSPPKTHSSTSSMPCILEGSVGIPAGHPIAPARFDACSQENWLSFAFKEAMNSMEQILIPLGEEERKSLAGNQWRGFGEPTHVVVCPLVSSEYNNLLAFLVIGLNPYRPFDDDYQSWVQLLTEQVTTPQISALILRQEIDRRRILATQEAMDRASLSRKLSESETKFARFATRAPIGLAILTAEGEALTANNLWRQFTALEVGSDKPSWNNVLMPGEFAHVTSAWEQVVTGKKPLQLHTRINIPWKAPDLTPDGKEQWTETYLLLDLYPDFDDEGNVSTIMSCISNISGIKWTENQLRTKMEQALEMKKQQERFIDMTSHEMRNPLSALIGCADEILSSLHEYQDYLEGYKKTASAKELRKHPTISKAHLIEEAIEAADTIIYCAMHQKRIIDDILTLSRLDSNLLVVCPEASQPVELIRNALKMFDAELKRADTKLDFVEHPSISNLQVRWTLLDPSRVLQVLINLITNAIKFTRTEPTRQITVNMTASLDPPSSHTTLVQFVPRRLDSVDQTDKPEWGNGEILYLSITVTDTGRGLSEKERANLFHLFMQASPKTHVQYGGSGLGLFISRQLTEMQGGQIGVHSERGKGSTFQFYIKTRRTHCPGESETRTDLQLLVREDALREACGVEMMDLGMGLGVGSGSAVGVGGSEDIKTALVRTRSRARIAAETPGVVRKNGMLLGGGDGDEGDEDKDRWHVLVVEDNLVNQKVVSKQLKKEGFRVSVANHGGEALDFLMRTEFWVGEGEGGGHEGVNGVAGPPLTLNVILMDLEMPVMDGLTCVKKIRELEALGKIKGHVPVIAVTANARKGMFVFSYLVFSSIPCSAPPILSVFAPNYLRQGIGYQIMKTINAGMDDVTTKPYRIQDMLKQIERLIAKYTQNSDGDGA
ncbi:hypothetical protein CJF30_00009413 [Rutstroemia sp. NJR-2017a BBW]|nr:hypothetical protein CJF30_00009413 [Rutstroemia sp. NJR-2017a BBW]